MFKHTIPALFPLITPGLTWKVNTTDKVLYLTFDDGPHPVITPKVLDILMEYNAKATFFCVGDNVKKYPDVFARIMDEGHAVGNHTFNHLSGWGTPDQKYYENVEQAKACIPSVLFRPPYGKITPAQIKKLKKHYRIIMWSVLTRDYEKGLKAEAASRDINAITKPGDIVVFHDSEKAEASMFLILRNLLIHFSDLQFKFERL